FDFLRFFGGHSPVAGTARYRLKADYDQCHRILSESGTMASVAHADFATTLEGKTKLAVLEFGMFHRRGTVHAGHGAGRSRGPALRHFGHGHRPVRLRKSQTRRLRMGVGAKYASQ